MIKNLTKVIFTIIIFMFITVTGGSYFNSVDLLAAEIYPGTDYGTGESLTENEQLKGEISEESKEDNKATKEEIVKEDKEENLIDDKDIRDIRPSETAYISIKLIRKNSKSKNTAKFILDFNLGDEVVNGVEELALADVLYIEDLDYTLPLEKQNELKVEFELAGLKNKKYNYYISSRNNLKYDGYFEISSLESDNESKSGVVFRGIPKKKVFEGTKVVLRMQSDDVDSLLIFNGKKIEPDKTDKGKRKFEIVVSKNGNYKYSVKSNDDITEGILKVDFFKNHKNKLDIPLSYQSPDYPEGCESYASVAVLKHFGFKIKESEFISKYLDMINLWDKRVTKIKNLFDKYYLGDPSNKKQQGYLANPPVLVKAVNKYFKKNKSKKYVAVDTTGKTLKKLLEEEVLNDNPVVVWLTIDNKEPHTAKVRGVPYVFPSHTMVISGYDRKKELLYLTDSISGYRSVSYDTANELYKLTGKKSFILQEKK